MLAMSPRVVEAVWASASALLPPRPPDEHPLGCHRPRIPDRVCFAGILYRLVLGCSWVVAGLLVGVGQATLRRRRDEWVAAGVFDRVYDEALRGYDRIVGLDLSDASVDGALHKAPCGGEGTGPNPTDRGKLGWKWSLATERAGIPIGWTVDGANRHDNPMFAPTLDAVAARGLLAEIETLHLDRGYDAANIRALCAERGLDDVVVSKRRPRGAGGTDVVDAADKTQAQDETQATAGAQDKRKINDQGKRRGGDKRSLGLGWRWTVERSNSWFSNYGQLRRNTDRFKIHRLAQIALAVTLIIAIKLIKWADRWNRAP